MFEAIRPLADLGVVLNGKAQAIVIANPDNPASNFSSLKEKWKDRAAFVMWEDTRIIYDMVRMLLYNPQIRAIVFDGPCETRESFAKVWRNEVDLQWKISNEHLALVRQFVDLYDDDFAHHGPQPPFWPVRIKYLE